MFHYKRWFIFGLLLLLMLFSACSSSESETGSSLPPATDNIKSGGMQLHESKLTKESSPESPKKTNLGNAEKQGRKITYQAQVRITVDHYKKSREKLETLVNKHQGYLVNSNERKEENSQRGTITFRVPQNQFQSFLKSLQSLSAKTPDIEINGNDVTEEMVDLESRLKAKKATEKRLLELMNKATEATALVEISRQLDQTQVEIEEIQGRLQYLNHRVDFSEVTVELEQIFGSQSASDQSLGQQMSQAFKESIQSLIYLGKSFLIFLVGFLPVMVVLSLIILPFYLWIKRRLRKTVKKSDTNKDN